MRKSQLLVRIWRQIYRFVRCLVLSFAFSLLLVLIFISISINMSHSGLRKHEEKLFCNVIGLRNIWIRLSTRVRIFSLFKTFHSGETIHKGCGFAYQIRRTHLNGRQIRKENVADSKISGYIRLNGAILTLNQSKSQTTFLYLVFNVLIIFLSYNVTFLLFQIIVIVLHLLLRKLIGPC